MTKKRIFNAAYFIASLAVFAWLLRDNPHMRLLPCLLYALCGLYGGLLLISFFKPNGFAVSSELSPISMGCQRRLRRWALLAPVPAFIYCALYMSCVQFAGEARCLNKFYGPIAKFERGAFCKDRMKTFYSLTHDKIRDAAVRYEHDQNWKMAESYYKAMIKLETRYTGNKYDPEAFGIMGCLYMRMGKHEKAEEYFTRCEQLVNHRCKLVRGDALIELVSFPHAVHDLGFFDHFAPGHEKNAGCLAQFAANDSSNVIGRHFMAASDCPDMKPHDCGNSGFWYNFHQDMPNCDEDHDCNAKPGLSYHHPSTKEDCPECKKPH